MSTASTDHYLKEFSALAQDLPGNTLPWLQQTRKRALDRFAALGFPTPRHEDWKYTNVRPIEKQAFRPTGKVCLGLVPDDIEAYLFQNLPCHRLVFVNGHFAPELSRPGKLSEGLTVGSLAKSLLRTPNSLESHLARYADASANGFEALNTAFMGDGAYVYLAAGKVIEDPIHLLFLSTQQEEPVFSQPRNLVVAGDNAQAVLIETYASLGDSAHFTNALTEVALGQNATLEHYKLQQESLKAYHIATLQVHQERDSRFTSHAVSFGARLARHNINVVLDAEGTECTLNGLYMVDGRQHVDFHTKIDHAKPHGTSHEFYKGILNGHARGVFNGRIYVHPDAQKTDAEQSNKNLLLSKDAEVDTKPQLEIYADDVKCSHGATVGQLDDTMLFYLRSRGIDEATARGLLTYGFAHDIVERMALAPIRARLEEILVNRLPQAAGIKEMV